MIKNYMKKIAITIASAGLIISMGTMVASAEATAKTSSSTEAATKAAQAQQNQQQRLANIKSKGDAEINRRLSSLNKLSDRISSDTRLSASDKSALTSQVSTEISNLTTLKTKLDGETTLDAASADAKSIISDYRVYALIVPKVMLIRTADDQLIVEDKLTTLSTKLQARISAAQTAGKDVSSLNTLLSDLNTQVANSKAISASIEQKVINLQPSDYDSDHTILTGDKTQLQTAHQANAKALQDAKNIAQGLKNLE